MKSSMLLRSISLVLFCFLISASAILAQSTSEKLDQLINTYLEYGQFNGSVLVAEEGKVIYKKGFGMANMEWDIPNDENTKHRLGSISKQFTGMLILQLAEAGKLDLQKPITTYLPDYPKESGDIITTHHLLTHTAGIPNYTSFPGFFNDMSRDPYTPEEFIKQFQDMELEFEPGSQFAYSNSGYFLLGVLVEKLSGKSYEDMLHEKIFEPLGMDDSGFDNHGDILKNRATGYEKSSGGFINAPYLDMSIPYAAGSLYSTAEDLYTWDQALYTNKLLSQEYMDMYFDGHIEAMGLEYAYGWVVGEESVGNTEEGIETIAHGGGINGFNTIISRAPSDKSLVVLLNNTGGAPLQDMTSSIRAILYGKSYDMPKKSLVQDMVAIAEAEGNEAGIAFFEKNKDNKEYELDEGEMNNLGYQLMGAGDLDAAAIVFKLNMETFPESFNTYDSYAEVMMNMEKKEEAIKYYKKSIEMNPANQNGIDMLKKLGEDTEELTKDPEIDEAILQSYVGKYELAPGFVLSITKEGNQLSGQATGQGAAEIYPKSETEFYLKIVQARIEFNVAEDGTVESLTLFQGGKEMLGKRMEK